MLLGTPRNIRCPSCVHAKESKRQMLAMPLRRLNCRSMQQPEGPRSAEDITRRHALTLLTGLGALTTAQHASAVSFAEKKAAVEARKKALLERRAAKLQGEELPEVPEYITDAVGADFSQAFSSSNQQGSVGTGRKVNRDALRTLPRRSVGGAATEVATRGAEPIEEPSEASLSFAERQSLEQQRKAELLAARREKLLGE
mmetsp:Transcript_9734/g.35661  ORF Transcript_9734/g.35661 Transcript_9734/m.35661 type:complete len:200 (-) Transcript_9734:140-739(-)